MITIRREQLRAIGLGAREQFLRALLVHVREHFPAETSHLGEHELEDVVAWCMTKARDFGLVTQRDLFRFAGLCASIGWDFEQRPEHAAIVAALRHPKVTDPSRRLDLAIDRYLRSADVATHNRQRRIAFAASTGGAQK